MRAHVIGFLTVGLALVLPPMPARAQYSLAGETIHITRATGPIVIDGDLSDERWRMATRVETFYEVSPGDNVEPKVKTVGYLTYDDRSFYLAFESSDPDPAGIPRPHGDQHQLYANSAHFLA